MRYLKYYNLLKKGEIAGTVLNDGVGQAKAVIALSTNLAAGKDATDRHRN